MINNFIKYLNNYVRLSEEDKKFLEENLSLKFFSKKSMILTEGQISKSFYFNLSGFVRLFYRKEAEEITAYFYGENLFISAYDSFTKKTPSKLNFQALEDTFLVNISQEASVRLLNYSSKFETLARIAMEEELIVHQKIIESLLTQSPEERYEDLLETNPSIFQRVSQQYLASYIGVKPESLSRIKKRHFKKNLNQSQ